MKIVYGVAGEGRGHASRAAALWPFLSEHMDLTVSCPESIGPFMEEKAPGVKLDLIPGIHFSLTGHKIGLSWFSAEKSAPHIQVQQNHRRDVMQNEGSRGAGGHQRF